MERKDQHENKLRGPGESKDDRQPEPETKDTAGKDDDDEEARELVGVTRGEHGVFVVPIMVSEEFYNEFVSAKGLKTTPITNIKLRRYGDSNTLVMTSGEPD